MAKFIRTLLNTAFFLMLLLFPFLGICQITTPAWVNNIGGAGANCVSSAVKTDAQNNIYVTGYYSGTVDFDSSAGVYNLTATAGSVDIYVAKYNTAGKFVWAVTIGGDDRDQPSSLTVDKDGNPIISGYYRSVNFDTDPGPATNIIPAKGGFDAFVIKLNTNGDFMWSKTIGGTGDDFGGRISVDSHGDMVSTIRYQSTVNIDGEVFTSRGEYNGLIIKYNPLGSLIWAINLSDEVDCRVGYGDFDHEDNFVVCGNFTGNVNFNPLGTESVLDGKGKALFLAKYTSQGQLIWANPVYGEVMDNNHNLCINSKNDIFLTGTYSFPLTFNNTVRPPLTTGLYVFLAKYTSAGEFKTVKTIGGTNSTVYNNGIVCSADDNIYLSGSFRGTINFNPAPNQIHTLIYHGGQDFFLAKYDEDINYKLAFGGGSLNCANSLGRNLAIDGNNDVIFTGGFCSTVDFSASDCASEEVTALGERDTYLAKYKQNEATRQGRITGFAIPQQIMPAKIDEDKLKITITVPKGTNITALIPTVTHTFNLRISPSSHRVQNFTNPIVYTLSTSCYSLNYVAEVVYSNTVTEKQITVCNGNTTELAGDVLTAPPDSYSWELLRTNTWASPEQGAFNGKDYQSGTLNNNTNSKVIKNYRRKVIIGGVTTYDSFYGVTILPEISDNTIATPANELICGSKDIDLIQGTTPTGGDGAYTYQWQSSATGADNDWSNISGAVSQSYDPPVVSEMIYYRRLITTCGQLLSSNTIHYNIRPAPLAPIVQNDTICAGNTATLVVNEVPGLTVKWYSNATDVTSISSGNTFITPPVNTNTTLYAEAVTTEGCVSARTPVSIIMAQPLPAPLVTIEKITLNSITFNWAAVTGATGYEISINGGVFAAVGDMLTHTVGALTIGQTVSLNVRATGGLSCQLGNSSVTIAGTASTSGANQIYVPNLFSPNGDGNNDVLYVRSAGIKSMVFYIYNQWGEMIFRSVNQSAGWDGTYKGSLLPLGVYVYYLEATMLDGSKLNKKGTVTLIF